MSHDSDDRHPLAPEDAAFVQRVADAYAPPPLAPGRRAAFDAELDSRLARDRWRFAPWAAAVVAAGAAALLVLARLPAPPVQELANAQDDATGEEEFVLALADGSSDAFENTLPADYQAIASLLDSE